MATFPLHVQACLLPNGRLTSAMDCVGFRQLRCPQMRPSVLSARTTDPAFRRGHWQHCTRALAPRAVNKPGIVSVLPGAVMRSRRGHIGPRGTRQIEQYICGSTHALACSDISRIL